MDYNKTPTAVISVHPHEGSSSAQTYQFIITSVGAYVFFAVTKNMKLDYINSPAHCCITQPPVAPSGDCERVIS